MGMLRVVCWFYCLRVGAAIGLRRFGDVANRYCGIAPALNVEHLFRAASKPSAVGRVAINMGRDK